MRYIACDITPSLLTMGNTNNPICVALPKVAKANTVVTCDSNSDTRQSCDCVTTCLVHFGQCNRFQLTKVSKMQYISVKIGESINYRKT